MTKITEYAKTVEVIKTKSVVGAGTKEDPLRTVIRYWTKDGRLIAEEDKANKEAG